MNVCAHRFYDMWWKYYDTEECKVESRLRYTDRLRNAETARQLALAEAALKAMNNLSSEAGEAPIQDNADSQRKLLC